MCKRTLRSSVLVILASAGLARGDDTTSWPTWRGPAGSGLAAMGSPPVRWSESSNVRWKIALPGRGHGTPVVWDRRIFVTTAVETGAPVASHDHAHHSDGAHHNVLPTRRQELRVLALDRDTGRTLWSRTVHEMQPHESTHETGSWASASPVTDGKTLIASFGSGGLFGLSLDGELLWSRQLGKLRIKHGHGEGSSPALAHGIVVVNHDHEDTSFVEAIDARTGKTRWRVDRNEGTSWSTPLIVHHGDRRQAVIAATSRVRSYDLTTGKAVWEVGGLSGNVVASPVEADGTVVVGSSYETRAMLGIRWREARGDLTGSPSVAWRRDRDTPYVPSPVLADGVACFLKHYQGILTCVTAATGETVHGPRRLRGIRNVYASPVVAAGRLYVVDLDGTTAVLRFGGEFEPLATNRLDESFAASPVVTGDALLLRGNRYLYLLAEPPGSDD